MKGNLLSHFNVLNYAALWSINFQSLHINFKLLKFSCCRLD